MVQYENYLHFDYFFNVAVLFFKHFKYCKCSYKKKKNLKISPIHFSNFRKNPGLIIWALHWYIDQML